MNNFKVLMNGIIKENPIFVLLLGMCPTLGTTSSAINGMGMGLATMFVLICSNVVISLIKNLIPDMVRIPSFIVVIASFVTLLQMVMQAYVPGLYATLGLFIPLIVVNCIVLGRAEAFAAKNNPISSMFNGLGWILGPLVGGLLIFGAPEGDSMALTKPYILVGGIVLFVALLFFFTKLPEIKLEEEEEVTAIVEEKPAASLWKRRQFVRSVVAQFCYCAAQTGIFGFFINYVTEMDPGISNLRASRILAFGGMALFMIGRLSGSFTMKWLAPGRLLTWYSLLSAVCMALVVASVGTLSLYALYLSFFFMSIMFPTIFALGLEGMGVYTKKASSYIVMGVAGGAFSPMLMGYIGEENMALGFIVPLIAFLYILYFAIKCKR